MFVIFPVWFMPGVFRCLLYFQFGLCQVCSGVCYISSLVYARCVQVFVIFPVWFMPGVCSGVCYISSLVYARCV